MENTNLMKHAKPKAPRNRPNGRVYVVATIAMAFIASLFGMYATANDSATPATQQVIGRVETCTLNTSSVCVINHGLGVKPTAVVATPAGPGQNITIDVSQINETSYTVKALWRDGKPFNNQPTISFNAVYTYVSDATTPPPTTTTPPVTTPPPTTTTPTPTPTPSPTPTPTQPSGACTNPSWTSSVQNYTKVFDSSTEVNNNVWNTGEAGPQTIGICAWNNWYIISDQPGAGHDDSVKSYADTQKHVTIPVSTSGPINSSWKVLTPTGGGTVPTNGKQWNAAYDLWLGDTPTANWDTEVMIWSNWTANWQYWYGVYHGEMVTFDGITYAAYHRAGTNSEAGGIWFIRQDVTNDGSVDMSKLLKWAQNKGWMASTSAVREIEYGFEVNYTGTPTRFDLLDYTLSY